MPKKEKIRIGILVALLLFGALILTIQYVPKENSARLKNNDSAENFVETPLKKETQTPTKPKNTQIAVKESTENKIESEKKNIESVTILIGDKETHLNVAHGTIFYDALVEARNTSKLTFSGKNYPDLGFFVTDIGSLHGGNGKNLIYYVNGKEATVGVSSYTLKDKDFIEWRLE